MTTNQEKGAGAGRVFGGSAYSASLVPIVPGDD